MQNYPVRVSHRANLRPESLSEIARTAFGSAALEEGSVIATFGALSALKARAAGKELQVEVTMNPKVPEEVAAETIRRYNSFLEQATGYNAKERAKRARKSAGGE